MGAESMAKVIPFPKRDADAVRALAARLPVLTDAQREAKARAFCESRWPVDDGRDPSAA